MSEFRKDRDRGDRGDRDKGGDDGGSIKRSFHRGRGCRFCAEPALKIDYKDSIILRPFLTERAKLVPRRISGNCAKHQRVLTLAVKRARHLAFIAYTSTQIRM
ncbi:MAG: 30S ribosomal protein S18 [Bdellovibrionaceae bacterium]|nr:30S ribosomal protein S18 [Pseudobdellovibrionaceae bacterium]